MYNIETWYSHNKMYSCIGIRYARFTCCLNMAFNLTIPIWALICLHDVTRESAATKTDHFSDAFVHENVARVYDVVATLLDVQKYDADDMLFREIQCKKRDTLMFKRRFSAV